MSASFTLIDAESGEEITPGTALVLSLDGEPSGWIFQRIHTTPDQGTPMLSVRDMISGRKTTIAAASFRVAWRQEEDVQEIAGVPVDDYSADAIDRMRAALTELGDRTGRTLDVQRVHSGTEDGYLWAVREWSPGAGEWFSLSHHTGWMHEADALRDALTMGADDPCPCETCENERAHEAASEIARVVRELAKDETVTRDEAAEVLSWARDWARDTFSDFEESDHEDAAVLRESNRRIDGGLSFVLADVRRCGARDVSALVEEETPCPDQSADCRRPGCVHSVESDAAKLEARPTDHVFGCSKSEVWDGTSEPCTCFEEIGCATRPEGLDDETADLLGIDANADDQRAGEILSGDRMTEDWLLANLPHGWDYDCTFAPEPAFVIIAPDRSKLLIPLRLLK